MKCGVWCVVLAVLLAACGGMTADEVEESGQSPEIFPDYVGVTVPVGIAPLNFAMQDDSVATMRVVLTGSKGGRLEVEGEFADFPIADWHGLLRQNRGGKLSVSVTARRKGMAWTRYPAFDIFVSNDPVGEWGITYRRIAPGYVLYGHMGLYQRELATFDEYLLEDNTSQPGTCLNCHTANRTSPNQYVYHRRADNAGTFIVDSLLGRRKVIPPKELGGSFVYPYWHPSGRYCAFSTNKTSQMFHLAGRQHKRIEVYDSSSDVFVYDVARRCVIRDTLIMRRLWAENTPAFSPDGRWLYFTTARRQVYPTDYDKECYSLCRVAFDERTGHIGQTVDTLVNSRLSTINSQLSTNSSPSTPGSVSWPRPSYDGRYVMFTVADHGYFTVWHPEADLWLLDLETRQSRPLDEVNSPRAESFHNWSLNSRWFLFTSRRTDGLYTRVYFSSIDGEGRATKPFLLPQRNPKEYDRTSLYSFNTPDFVSGKITR